MAMTDEFLTTEEVSAYLKIPVATLHQWSYRGKGPLSARIGRGRRYRRSDLEAWIAAQYDLTGEA